jgi:hypothetical protein
MPLIDFLKMDYAKLQQYLYEQWDENLDTQTSATGTRLMKVLSSVGFMNVVYLVKSHKNAIFSEASDRNIIIKKARSEKGYKSLPVVSSYVEIVFSIPSAKSTRVIIPKWTQLTTQNLTTNYTFYTIEDAYILPGDLTTSVLAVEGSRIQLTYVAQGDNYESFEIKRTDITLREIEVQVNGTPWEMVNDIIDATFTSYSWTYEPGEDGKINVMFGNGTYGKKLSINDVVDIWCLISDGSAGNLKSDCITKVDSVIYDSTHTTVTDISCTNPGKPYGGSEMEDEETIKERAYNAYKSNWGLVTVPQYTAGLEAQPGVDRAYCIDINTSISVPFRQVWGYLVDSEGENVRDPYLTSAKNFVEARQVIGNEFYVKPISYVNYVFTVNIWLHTGYLSSSVITDITNLVSTTYSKPGMEIATDVLLSKIGSDINAMDAIANYAIISPAMDVAVPSGYLANAVTITVNFMGYL